MSQLDVKRRREVYAARDEVYAPQSAVPDDAAYEALIRSAWRVPGSVAADGQGTFFDPHEPIHTEPADLEDAKHSTEAGAGFVIAVAVAALAICAGLFLAGRMGAL